MLGKIISTFRYYSDKRFSTIAGTLVYFLLMSITPFLFWLTLVFGDVHIEELLNHNFFESVAPFLRYLKDSAESAASGAGIVLLVTSLYSSTNFFYHLRRSGEIIYDVPVMASEFPAKAFTRMPFSLALTELPLMRRDPSPFSALMPSRFAPMMVLPLISTSRPQLQ